MTSEVDTSLTPGGERRGAAARISLPPATALPADLQHMVEKSGEQSIRAWGHNPVTAGPFFAFMGAVMDPESGSLSMAERELIAVVVARETGCSLSAIYHLRALTEHLGDHDRAIRIAFAPAAAGLSDRELAIADAAVLITRSPTDFRSKHVADLYAVGLCGAEVFGVIEVTAAYNCAARVEACLGLTPSE